MKGFNFEGNKGFDFEDMKGFDFDSAEYKCVNMKKEDKKKVKLVLMMVEKIVTEVEGVTEEGC